MTSTTGGRAFKLGTTIPVDLTRFGVLFPILWGGLIGGISFSNPPSDFAFVRTAVVAGGGMAVMFGGWVELDGEPGPRVTLGCGRLRNWRSTSLSPLGGN
jgi:hypothetical protein